MKHPIKLLFTSMLTAGLLFSSPASSENPLERSSYRYLNQKCEFSYQLPEAPRSETIWGETPLPITILTNPGYGEVAEHIIYKTASFDGKDFFSYETYCIFADKRVLEDIDTRLLEVELENQRKTLQVKNHVIQSQDLPKGLKVGSLSGYVVNQKTQNVTSYHLKIMRGLKSIMLVKVSYNSEYIENEDLFKAIDESFIFEGR